MRISTNQIYLRGMLGMQRRQVDTLRLQEQLSSGKRVQTPSDDPIASAKIELMKHRIESAATYQDNTNAAKGTLAYEESILSNTVGVLHNIKELQLQAGNGALSLADRKVLATEANNLLEQLQGLANTQDSNGYYIFSGSRSLSQTISKDINGNYVYNGDETVRMQDISSGLTVALNDTGDDIFMNIKNGNGQFTVSQPAAPNVGNATVSTGAVVNPTAYIPDNYTMQFALNTLGQTVVMVTGATSGNVLPATGLPDDAPVYQPGSSITFNGIEVTVKGTPQVGDSFTIAPSTNESIFSSLKRIITNLNRAYETPTDKAVIETENNQLLDNLDSALDNVLQHRSMVGARMNQLEVAELVNEDLMSTSKESLSLLQDADLASAAVELNLQTIFLQAAQQSFAKIQGLSLFNFMR